LEIACARECTAFVVENAAVDACGCGEHGRLRLNSRQHQRQRARVGGAEVHGDGLEASRHGHALVVMSKRVKLQASVSSCSSELLPKCPPSATMHPACRERQTGRQPARERAEEVHRIRSCTSYSPQNAVLDPGDTPHTHGLHRACALCGGQESDEHHPLSRSRVFRDSRGLGAEGWRIPSWRPQSLAAERGLGLSAGSGRRVALICFFTESACERER
jgi:hypothetical protein